MPPYNTKFLNSENKVLIKGLLKVSNMQGKG
jgi:hypothetical protein